MPFDLASVRVRLPDRRIDWFQSVASTMTLAARLAQDGCLSGTIVGADGQVAGIGRHGHTWHSEAEAGLYVSIVLCIPIGTHDLPVVMLALGLATQEAIADAAGLAADLRWPNDVMIEGRKCAGILAQLEGGAVVAGIGINVNHTLFPVEIEPLATSLKLEGKRGVSREDLLVSLVKSIEACCKILTTDGPAAILKMFARASSYAEGRRVRVEKDGAMIEGVTCGLNPSGFLVIREDDGKEITILAGGVRPV
jgi:BirA family transcriptional regulator, biotin operon repressor / biotin---[acetyl-CoA-carboxylase] ligase